MLKREQKRYCLYLHFSKTTGKVFYVGIGLLRRPFEKTKRSQFWNNVAKSEGFIAKIKYENLDWNEACYWEKFYISIYGRRDLGTGILVNMTSGGDGSVGHIGYWRNRKRPEVKNWLKSNYRPNYKDNPMPDRIREKIRKSLTGKKHKPESINKMKQREPWNKGLTGVQKSRKGIPTGHKMNDKTREALIKANTGRKMSEKQKIKMSGVHKGKVTSQEVKDKIRKALLGRKASEESRKKMSEACRQSWDRPGRREKKSSELKKRWQNEAYKENTKKSIIKSWTKRRAA